MFWGQCQFWQCGSATNPIFDPTPVPGLPNVRTVAPTPYSMTALLENGTLYTWGQNYYGLLGDTTSGLRQNPALIGGALNNVNLVDVAYGTYCLAAASVDGRVFVWGDNSDFKLARPASVTTQTVPIELTFPNHTILKVSFGQDGLFQYVAATALGRNKVTGAIEILSWGLNAQNWYLLDQVDENTYITSPRVAQLKNTPLEKKTITKISSNSVR